MVQLAVDDDQALRQSEAVDDLEERFPKRGVHVHHGLGLFFRVGLLLAGLQQIALRFGLVVRVHQFPKEGVLFGDRVDHVQDYVGRQQLLDRFGDATERVLLQEKAKRVLLVLVVDRRVVVRFEEDAVVLQADQLPNQRGFAGQLVAHDCH